MKGRLVGLTRGFDDDQNITVAVKADFREQFEALRSYDVDVEIKRHRQHRSLEANAYAWLLIGKIVAERQDHDPDAQWTVEKYYQKIIRDIGGVYTVVGMKKDAIPAFRASWTAGHLGRMVEELHGSTKDGWANVKVYYGSSDYDSAQMSRLINAIVQDAESLGIPTITQKEMDRMMGGWAKAHDRVTAAE